MRSLYLFPLALVASPALAQADPAQDVDSGFPQADLETDDDMQRQGSEILVVATRLRGQLNVPQAPILTLDEADIEAYGADSLSDLLAQLSPQTGSGRGRGDGHPVVLLNGQRISSFREMRDIPPEAIRRMEILPEEVALRFGYPPNQRVVNFILKDKFATRTVAGEYNIPTLGGFTDTELEAGLFRISGPSRFNIRGKIDNTTMLTEAERGVRQASQPAPGAPDPAAYRSLIDASRQYAVNATWSTPLGKDGIDGSLTINGALTRSRNRSLFGLDAYDDPLRRHSQATTAEGGIGYNRMIGGWQLSATTNASFGDTRTRVDDPATPPAPTGLNRARTRDTAVNALVTMAGAPLRMPAGEAMLTVKAGFDYTGSDNSDTASGRATMLKRGDVSTGVNLALPLTSRKQGVLGGAGDVSLNLSAGLNRLSDFGTLTDWSAGLNWSPTAKLGFQASYIVNDAAPSLSQLGNPQLLAYNVSVYDFTRGETALVTIVNGGNPALRKERQRDLKLSGNWELPVLKNANLVVEYFRNRSNDVTQSFPLLTPAIEAAFPGRVERDAAGRLVSIDRRPVTFDQVKSSRLRWGFNISGSYGKALAGSGARNPMAGAMGGHRPPGGAPRGGFGRGMGGPGGPGGPMGGANDGKGRWNLSLFHTVQLTSVVTVAPGGPVLDLLDGEAISAGGLARHALEMEGGTFYRGFGVRLNGSWTAPARITAGGLAGSSDLRFGSVLKIDGRLFVNFDQRKSIIKAVPFLKGARLAFEFENILNSRQKVTDGGGTVPISYQADYRDARGRVVGLDFRKMF
ncbi:MAG: TonB-dependent receptor [Novosphingobium sp.]|nr:TonB-dependent receptor [Novosphingobium sp.]